MNEKSPVKFTAKARVVYDPPNPEILLQAELLEFGDKVHSGTIVKSVALPWIEIYKELEFNPDFLQQFVGHPRKLEEFIAGAYEKAGFNVILTPRSADGGRDLIASKIGFGSIRLIEKIKAYKPGHLVKHDDIRAMLGVLHACLLYTSPSPRDRTRSRMPSSA